MSEQLPSVDDLLESKLPSVDEFIKEENLPSVDEFLEEKEEEVIEEETIEEPVEEAADLTEIVRLINDVRKDIPVVPEIPEIKYYDEELEKLTAYVEEIKESIPEIPEQKTYDVEVEAICDLIDNLREEVKDLPVPKYYEEEIETLQKKVDGFYQDMMELPEPKYYEEDLKSLKEEILEVREAIPTFPKWVNEVNEVPDFKWIGKTFSVIDDDFIKVQDNLDSIKNRIDQEVQQISETIDVKRFESKTDINKLNEDLTKTKDKIYKELREAALKIYDTKNGYKDDDRKLKKNILSQYNVLKQKVEEEVKEFNRKNNEVKDLYGGYFEGLTQEIANFPEVKYYDEDIERLSGDVKNLKSLYLIVEEIREKQKAFKKEFNEVKDLQEGLLNEPNDEKQSVDGSSDPLTPLDKQFPTLKSLADHYRLFISRTQQQIATIGGGGAGFMKDLADVTFSDSTGTNKLLIYNGDGWVGIASTALSGSSTLHEALTKGNVSGIGMSVGVITATNGYFSGIVTAAQLNYDVVTDIYSTGIVTATKGIQVTTLGLNVASGISTLTDGLRVGSAATIYSNGNVTCGIVTATKYYGDGSSLSNVTSTTINNNANNRLITGSGTANTLEGESTLTYDGAALSVSTGATVFTNGNIACGIITATSFTVGGTSLAETIADTVGGMVGSNTETGITVTYEDGDNTLDFVVGTLNQDTTGTADNFTCTANNSTDETVYPVFVDGATGSQGGETDTGLTYNPSDGNLTATTFTGALTGNVTGNASGSSGSCTGNAAGLTGTPNITVGDVVAASLDISGNADIDGTLEADAYTVDGTALNEYIADTVGAMVSSNTESGITVAYVDDDNTLDFTVGTLNQDTTGTADNITVSANNSTNETVYPIFVDGATGSQGAESDTGLTYNPNSGTLTSTVFSGSGASLTNIPGIPSESDTSVSSTSATTVATFSASTYRTAFVDVQITQGSAYQAGQYALIHDGTTATIVEKVAVATGSMLGTLTATVSGGNMLLQVNMGSSSSATVTVKSSTLTV